jgi:MFS family permease
LAPIAIATTLLNAAVETAGLSFIVLYATGMGWSEEQGLRLVSTLMVGAIVLQLPIGWLADRVDPRRLALLLAVLSAVGALAWPWMLGQTWLAFALVFVWGGLFVGIYTVMLSIVGSRFSGGDLVGIYAVMSIAWGGGALIGPSIVGFAMQASATYGLPYSIAIGCAAFALFMLVRRGTA